MRTFIVLLSVLLVGSCSWVKDIQLTTTQDTPVLVDPPKVKPVKLHRLQFRVVNEANLEEYLSEQSKMGEIVFIALSVDDYEKMALNVAELRRYILEEQRVIVYYKSVLSAYPGKTEKP